MYIPKINLMDDKTEIVEFMQRFSFATIITATNNYPVATHLPFVVTVLDNTIILTSHFAKANDQWRQIENNKILVIFSEPHAYISTKNYEKEMDVPTWNYIAVHAYGQGKIYTATDEVYQLLEKTIDNYDADYKQQWYNLPEDYKLRMSKGIVGFEIIVTDLEAKKKISQNRSETEQKNIINALTNSTATNEKLIADYMKQNQKR